MGECFRGWRRKIGCLTLFMALVLTGGWMRSLVVRDEVSFSPRPYWHGEIVSQQASLGWHTYQLISTGPSFQAYEFPMMLSSVDNRTYFDCSPILEDTLVWHWKRAGFGYGAGITHLRGMTAQVWIIPYWSIVAPLTLLSSFLLLTTPRKSTLKKITEPIPADGN